MVFLLFQILAIVKRFATHYQHKNMNVYIECSVNSLFQPNMVYYGFLWALMKRQIYTMSYIHTHTIVWLRHAPSCSKYYQFISFVCFLLFFKSFSYLNRRIFREKITKDRSLKHQLDFFREN